MSFRHMDLSLPATCVACAIILLASTAQAQQANFGIPKMLARGLVRSVEPLNSSPDEHLSGMSKMKDSARLKGGASVVMGHEVLPLSTSGHPENLPRLTVWASETHDGLNRSLSPGDAIARDLKSESLRFEVSPKNAAKAESYEADKGASDTDSSWAADGARR